MYIVMFSINPLFPGHIMGGAPKHLQNIAVYMGTLGHEVKVLCTRTQGNEIPFKWHDNVEVLPTLRFKQPFPQPYDIPAYDMALALQDVGDYLQRADRFYMHDGEFLFPYAYQDVPTVVSLRDNVYPETLIGGFLFQADRLVLISEYSRRYIEGTVGRFFPGLGSRIKVIHNGIDWQRFRPVEPRRILDVIPVNPAEQQIVLHPHRPEGTKGIQHTIAVVDRLVHQHGLDRVVGLAPRWLEHQLTPDLREFYAGLEAEIAVRGLEDHFIFHDWVPQELMPEYFSMGAVTLSLGSFVESFGNAVYESLGCGTPSIAARIATHRELLSEALLDKVDYGDVDEVASIAARIIQNGERTHPEVIEYLHKHYAVEGQLQAYADVILNAEVATPLKYKHPSMDQLTRFKLAPWCYRSANGVYHDFNADYRELDAFAPLFDREDGFTRADATAYGIDETQVTMLFREGYLVPLQE